MLEAKQDELLLADRLAGFDQHVTAAVDIVMVVDAACALVAKLGRRARLQRTASPANPAARRSDRRGSGRPVASVNAGLNSWATGPSGLMIRSGITRSRGDASLPADVARPRLRTESTGLDSSLAGSVSGPRTPSRNNGSNAVVNLACRLSRRSGVSVAAFRSR